METKDLRIAPVSELADRTHKKRPHSFGMQPFTIAEREGLCSLPLRIPSPLAAGPLQRD